MGKNIFSTRSLVISIVAALGSLLFGFALAVLVQLFGINTIIDYAPKTFAKAGWIIHVGLFATFCLGMINFVFTWVSVLLIDKFGRRPLYIIGSSGMYIILSGLVIVGLTGNFEGIIVFVLTMLFIASFASSIGSVFLVYVAEIFPNKVRGVAMSISVFKQLIFIALVVLVFPAMLYNFHVSLSPGIILVFAILQLYLAIKHMPETKGKLREEIEKLWV